MSELSYNVAKLVKALAEAKAAHVKAVAKANKVSSELLHTGVDEYLAGNGDPIKVKCTIIRKAVTEKLYDQQIAQLGLVDGDSVEASALLGSVARLLNEAEILTACDSIVHIG